MIYDKSNDAIYRPIAGCPNFTPNEFACPCGICNHIILDLRIPEYLQKTRNFIGRPVNINKGGGYRCQRYNDDLIARGYEASKKSRHLSGQAADVSVEGLDGLQIAMYLFMAGFRRIGVAKTWCHADVGPSNAIWKYSSLTQNELDYLKKQIASVFR